jgi:hypothetical protein
MEIDPAYCNVTVIRLQDYTGKKACGCRGASQNDRPRRVS